MAAYCSKCGVELSADSKFCNSCGASANDANQNVENSAKPEVHKNENIENIINSGKKEFQEKNKDGKLYQIGGWICVGLAIIFTWLFAIGAIALGYLYRKYNEKHGKIIMIVGIILTAIGILMFLFSGSDEPTVYYYYYWW